MVSGSVVHVPTGQGKLEKVREFEWSGKGQGKIIFWEKSGKMKNFCNQISDFWAKMHQIRFCAEALPQTPLAELTVLPRPLAALHIAP